MNKPILVNYNKTVTKIQPSLFPPETPIPLMSVDEIYDSANQTLLEELKEDRQKKLKDSSNTIYFRRFVVKKGMEKEF